MGQQVEEKGWGGEQEDTKRRRKRARSRGSSSPSQVGLSVCQDILVKIVFNSIQVFFIKF